MSPMAPSHLTLSDLERSNSRSLIFKGQKRLGHVLLLNININRKPYMVSSAAATVKFKVKVKVTQISKP